MRFEKGHKENTRKRIIGVASRRFRKDGAAASGLAGIMAESGLTNGAFYPHFASKEALIKEALASALVDKTDKLEHDTENGRGIEGAIGEYLNREHVGDSEGGCPSAALLPEIARQSKLTRKAYEDGLLAYLSKLGEHLPEADSNASTRRAIAIFSVMVGALQIARAVQDKALAEDILEAGTEAAMTLARSHDTGVGGASRKGRIPHSPSQGRRIRKSTTKHR
jgi:TetR/AcrR family transcriptional regulator, transcriptional repressor for nem operon